MNFKKFSILLLVFFATSACSAKNIFQKPDERPGAPINVYDSFVQIKNKISFTICPLVKKDEKVVVDKDNCKKREDVKFSSASGFALDNSRRTKHIATAAHVCRIPASQKTNIKMMGLLKGVLIKNLRISSMTAITDSVKKYKLKIDTISDKIDACSTRIKGKGHLPALKLSKKAPKRGYRFLHLAATFGIHGEDLVLQQSGLYSGRKNGLDFYTIPVAPGSSGGPIMTKKGKVVGLVSLGPRNFDDVAISPSYPKFYSFYKKQIKD